MQGTIVMLMALSGLGCHHKSCDVAYAPSCYSGACYGNSYASDYETVVEPSCYSACYGTSYSGCYSGCYGGGYGGGWDGCYGGSWDSGYGGCWGGGRKGCGLFSGLFSCFTGRAGGHFGRHHGSWNTCTEFPVEYGCYSTTYSSYSPAVFGSGMPIYETPMSTGQSMSAPSSYMAPATAAPAADKPADKPAAAAEETSAPTPPAPAPVPPASTTPPPAPAPVPSTPADAVKELVKPKT